MDPFLIIPDHTEKDADIMKFSFTDDDSGDWFTSFEMEENELFYFDTEKGQAFTILFL